MTELLNRYDFVYLFDVTNGNPNGDPDAGNLPPLLRLAAGCAWRDLDRDQHARCRPAVLS